MAFLKTLYAENFEEKPKNFWVRVAKSRNASRVKPADQPRKKSVFVSPSPIKNRTYVNDMVAKIDERKRKGIKKPPAKVTKRPKKKIIYDDFGEPLREVWVDE